MRDIKFRGFDVKLKKWHNNLCVGIQNFKSDDVVFMQYTGLKDKNEKEIYEGDIIKLLNCSSFDCKFYEIVFKDGAFCGKWLEKLYKDWEKIGKYTYLDILVREYKLEVIGNIYKNPELLKDVK